MWPLLHSRTAKVGLIRSNSLRVAEGWVCLRCRQGLDAGGGLLGRPPGAYAPSRVSGGKDDGGAPVSWMSLAARTLSLACPSASSALSTRPVASCSNPVHVLTSFFVSSTLLLSSSSLSSTFDVCSSSRNVIWSPASSTTVSTALLTSSSSSFLKISRAR